MESVLEPLKEFSKNSVRLVKRCTKPDRRGMLPFRVLDAGLNCALTCKTAASATDHKVFSDGVGHIDAASDLCA